MSLQSVPAARVWDVSVDVQDQRDSLKYWPPKTAYDTPDYLIDLTAWLAATGDKIGAQPLTTVYGIDTPPQVMKQAFNAASCAYRLTGGTPGSVYVVSTFFQLLSGQGLQLEACLQILESGAVDFSPLPAVVRFNGTPLAYAHDEIVLGGAGVA